MIFEQNDAGSNVSLVWNAYPILVIDYGRIAEQGRHEELPGNLNQVQETRTIFIIWMKISAALSAHTQS